MRSELKKGAHYFAFATLKYAEDEKKSIINHAGDARRIISNYSSGSASPMFIKSYS